MWLILTTPPHGKRATHWWSHRAKGRTATYMFEGMKALPWVPGILRTRSGPWSGGRLWVASSCLLHNPVDLSCMDVLQQILPENVYMMAHHSRNL